MQLSLSSSEDSEAAIRRAVLLALMFLVPAVQAMLPIDDPDLWWRFRMGEWIVTHRTVPYVDHFSANDMGKPWIEYSWVFALIVYWVHSYLGLVGIVYFIVLMGTSVAYAAYRLIRGAGLPIHAEVALVAMALGTMKSLMTPRPWLITILFFAVELLIIYRARTTEKERLLWFLPILFVVWANIHIQFVYGLAAVGLLFGEALLASCTKSLGWNLVVPALSLRTLASVTLACVAATFLTPYHYLLYDQVFSYMFVQVGAFQYLAELHPMFFRSPGDWLVLAMTIFAAFALGWHRKWSPFSIMLLVIAAFVAFRARRDVWMIALVSLAIIGDTARSVLPNKVYDFSKGQLLVAALVSIAVLFFIGYSRGIDEKNLKSVVQDKFPVQAVNYIKNHRLPGPLFNHYDWGGFLLWSLPEIPVSMDGRTNLFGDRRIERSLAAWDGRAGWESEPDLLKARLVIAEKSRPLTTLLKSHAGFKVVYEDHNSVVFVGEPSSTGK